MTRPTRMLILNTAAFTVCFAVWMLYGVLIKYLTQSGLYSWSATEAGVLIGTPVLTGAVTRLPVGLLTDRFGGRPVFTAVMALSALGVCMVSFATGFWPFFATGLLFGLSGASFAVGIAYTSVWFEQRRQGTALGIFGMGNSGAALTLMFAPRLLDWLTRGGTDPAGWRTLPLCYGAATAVMAVIFWMLTDNRMAPSAARRSLSARLMPLRKLQVWRFGFYYFLVFGGFVGLSGWLVKYYVDVYGMGLGTAGLLATAFSLPSGVIRALGGWWSDRRGARGVMYVVLGTCCIASLVLCFPLDVYTFTLVTCLVGIAMGIGMAAVYKHIPTYFPEEVGVVGGLVGVLGGLGGFVCPVIFGALLDLTRSPTSPSGLWTSSWMFVTALSVLCLVWMHRAIRGIERQRASLVSPLEQPAQ